jgi:heme A synthase
MLGFGASIVFIAAIFIFVNAGLIYLAVRYRKKNPAISKMCVIGLIFLDFMAIFGLADVFFPRT